MTSSLPQGSSLRRRSRALKKRKKRKPEPEASPPRLTRFEKARVIAVRSLQIAMGAPLFIEPPPGVTDPIKIAKAELEAGVLPMIIERRLPDGSTQQISLHWAKRSSAPKR